MQHLRSVYNDAEFKMELVPDGHVKLYTAESYKRTFGREASCDGLSASEFVTKFGTFMGYKVLHGNLDIWSLIPKEVSGTLQRRTLDSGCVARPGCKQIAHRLLCLFLPPWLDEPVIWGDSFCLRLYVVLTAHWFPCSPGLCQTSRSFSSTSGA
jgi:hypothetical protein